LAGQISGPGRFPLSPPAGSVGSRMHVRNRLFFFLSCLRYCPPFVAQQGANGGRSDSFRSSYRVSRWRPFSLSYFPHGRPDRYTGTAFYFSFRVFVKGCSPELWFSDLWKSSDRVLQLPSPPAMNGFTHFSFPFTFAVGKEAVGRNKGKNEFEGERT